MRSHNSIITSDYNYKLPEERIAKYPLETREQSKLLVYQKDEIQQTNFSKLSELLPTCSQLYFNNTRVIHARLKFKRATGSTIEVFCLNPLEPYDYQLAFSSTKSCTWSCIIGNLKKWKEPELSLAGTIDNKPVELIAQKTRTDEGEIQVTFSWNGGFSFGQIINHLGIIPIPPYLNRESEDDDQTRYQTVYSRIDGSVAAPTAGLHFTPEILQELRNKKIEINEVTLHVGAGTFQPVKSEDAREHKMHHEFIRVPRQIIEQLAQADKTVIATGTTTLRTLESLYWLALKSIIQNKISDNLEQWEYENYTSPLHKAEVFMRFAEMLKEHDLQEYSAYTGIMIVPGYKFRVVDGLITNFHQPQSTLLMLISAFIGADWRKVYAYALEHDFRFLSYGDSSLLWNNYPD